MTTRRRARGAAVDSLALYARVSKPAFETVDEVALAAGVSKAELVDAVLLHLRESLDARGVPAWWPKPVPSTQELLTA